MLPTRKGGPLSSVRMLLEAGARQAGNEDVQDTAVYSTDPVTDSKHPILAILLEKMKPSTEALCRAIERKAPRWAEQLTRAGADPNAWSRRTETAPLLDALSAPGSADAGTLGPRLLKMLLDAGADPERPLFNEGGTNYPGPTPLAWAVENGAWWAIPTLAGAGADPVATLQVLETQRYARLEPQTYALLKLTAELRGRGSEKRHRLG